MNKKLVAQGRFELPARHSSDSYHYYYCAYLAVIMRGWTSLAFMVILREVSSPHNLHSLPLEVACLPPTDISAHMGSWLILLAHAFLLKSEISLVSVCQRTFLCQVEDSNPHAQTFFFAGLLHYSSFPWQVPLYSRQSSVYSLIGASSAGFSLY